MNYRHLLSLLFVALSLHAWAEQIPESTARQIARQVLSGFSPLRSSVSPVLAYQAPNSLRAGSGADYFIYTPDQGSGFVIVSGDDRAYPVLGYSPSAPFSAEHMPAAMSAWLENYQNELAHATVSEAPESVARQWNAFLKGTSQLGTGRVLSTALWEQANPFNRMTPAIEGQPTLVGCVAVAMGIIMQYHQYPQKAVNTPSSQTIKVLGKPVSVNVDYSEPYDWSNILPSYQPYNYNDSQSMEVSRLLYHCGVNVGMDYNVNMSGALDESVPIVMRDIFGYSPSIQLLQKKQVNWETWKALIRADIDEGLPVYYSGRNGAVGHAFVCDGYSDEYFHFNWGWEGYCDGYYLLSALMPSISDYTSEQKAIFHIRPTIGGELADPVFTVMNANYVVAGTEVRGSCTVYYAGMDPTTYKIRLGLIDAENKIALSPSGNIITCDFNPFTRVAQNFSIDLGRALSAGESVVLLGSADGEHWKILPTAPDVPLGMDSNGMITPPQDKTSDPDDYLYLNPLGRGLNCELYFSTGLMDNTVTSYNHVFGTYYHLSRPVDITFTYTIADYERWKGKLAIFSGSDQAVGNANAGDPVTIKEDGTFSVRIPGNSVSPSELYPHFWKMFSSQQGELKYTVAATAEGYDHPIYTADDCTIHFVEHSKSSWESDEQEGKVGQKMILKPTIPYLDPYFEGKDLQVKITVQRLTIDEYELYRSDGKPIPMKAYDNEPEIHFSPEPVTIWEKGKKVYDLVLVPKVAKTGDKKPIISTNLYHKGFILPTRSHACTLTIQPNDTAIDEIGSQSTQLSTEPGAVVIHLEQDATVSIYTLQGKWMATEQYAAGDYRIPLVKGAYLVKVNQQVFKILL